LVLFFNFDIDIKSTLKRCNQIHGLAQNGHEKSALKALTDGVLAEAVSPEIEFHSVSESCKLSGIPFWYQRVMMIFHCI
jgi:hypothetical protein